MNNQQFEQEIKSIERKAVWFAIIGTLILMSPVFWIWYQTDPLFK